MIKVRFKRIDPEVAPPEYQTGGSVCFDLAPSEDAVIAPGEIKRLKTGLVVETPPGYMLMVAARSSTPKKLGLMMAQSVGIVDQDYSGDADELLLQMYNFTDQPVAVKKGARIAQAGFVRIDQAELVETTETMSESRGGFGSTGGHHG